MVEGKSKVTGLTPKAHTVFTHKRSATAATQVQINKDICKCILFTFCVSKYSLKYKTYKCRLLSIYQPAPVRRYWLDK